MLDEQLYVCGRIKDMIIVRGKNVYSTDLEQSAESAHDALMPAASAAFAVNVNGEEQLVIAHEVKPGRESVDVHEVADAVRKVVGRTHMLPVHEVLLVASGSL